MSYDKKGYLFEEYKLFYLSDKSNRTFEYHYHDFDKLIVFAGGEVTYCIEGKNYELSTGDIVLVPRNRIHKPFVSKDSTYTRYVLYFDRRFFEGDNRLRYCFCEAEDRNVNIIRMPAGEFEKLTEVLGKAYKKQTSDDYCNDLHTRLYVTQALLSINEFVSKNPLEYGGNVACNPKIVECCEYINHHIGEDLSIDSLAARFHLSRYYFMREFKAATGYSVHKYILEKRLLFTEAKVEEGEKITKACLDAGFSDYSTYLRAKKRVTQIATEVDN